jgi:two-component system chemotaxis sensor kinase CheA
MARRLKGEARIEGQPGKGTCLTLEVPLSLSAITVLEFEVGPHTFALPLDGVRGVVQLEANAGATLAHAGREIPLLSLASLLPAGDPAPRVAVLVSSADECLALGVDHLLGASEVVIKPLPGSLGASPLVSGACFDATGVPRPLLDPRGLVEAARAGARPVAAAAPARNMPILVIDDSLTTRMLEQSILESAGYEVDLAVHAEDGLVKARERAYGLFIVDVEMPGMTGYEFVALTRQDPVLGRIPAMLVTSLATPLDRQRGVDAGASAYIVKGEFEQGGFLANVQRLLLVEGQGHG